MHLGASGAVALLSAALVFGLWYPHPFDQLVGGRELFLLIVSVDLVSGPVLTLVVFNPRKPRPELVRDISVIVVLQLAALGYGLFTVMQARPVLLAFEGNRFRVIAAAELDMETLHEAHGDLGRLSLTGPRLIGVRLAAAGDADYLQSIKQSLEGLHPAFRPSRWVPYEQQLKEAASQAKPLGDLLARNPSQAADIDEAAQETMLPMERLGYVPLQSRTRSDWVVVVDRQTGWPKAFAHVDGW